MFVYIYIFFFSIVIYYRILNTVLCAYTVKDVLCLCVYINHIHNGILLSHEKE